jgi:hypothetical protein
MAKDMKKKCLNCGEAELFAMVTITKAVPLADKGGTIKIGGQKIGQMDLKWTWDKIANKDDAPDQKIRGPIVCGSCEQEHFFVVGDKNPLRKGSVVEARELGYDELLTKS